MPDDSAVEIEAATAMIQKDPSTAANYILRACLYVPAARYEEAIADYEKALELDPPNFSADDYDMLGFLHNGLGHFDEAIKYSSKAIEMDPDNSHGYEVRASAYSDLGEFGPAFDDIDKGLAMNPEDLGSFYGTRGKIYQKAGDDRKAIDEYTKAIDLYPDSPVDRALQHLSRSTAYFVLGDTSKAFYDINAAAALGLKDEAETLLKIYFEDP
jgi:tetratricopeptide (TPR) repeat protein